MSKIYLIDDLLSQIEEWRSDGLVIVFTNGCFDLIHRGHIDYLIAAKELGNKMVIGLNSDASVKRLKGQSRPFIDETDRAFILSHIRCVDAVCIFSEDTPYRLISEVQPHILVKGADYKTEEIVGADLVKNLGGQVITIPLSKGKSTTNLIAKISGQV